MNANGLNDIQDLVNLDEKDIEQLLKIIHTGPPPVVVPVLVQRRLNIFSFWVNNRNHLHEPIEAGLFNQAALEAYGATMALMMKDEDIIIKEPAQHKTASKWKAFKEEAIACMNGIKGKHNIPLAYIIREHKASLGNPAYQSDHHRIIVITLLVGPEFDEDNRKVFDLLKSWIINGPAWTWMRAYNPTRNGCQAWLSLVNHFEKDAQRDIFKDAA